MGTASYVVAENGKRYDTGYKAPASTPSTPAKSTASPYPTTTPVSKQSSGGGSSNKVSSISPYATASTSKTTTTSGVKGVNANNNNILSQLKNYLGGTAAVPKPGGVAPAKTNNTYDIKSTAKTSKLPDWTKENWSLDYGKFLNDLQANPDKLEAERQRTLQKMQVAGGGSKDQIAHLQRVEGMMKNVAQGGAPNMATPQKTSSGGYSPINIANNQSINAPDGRIVNRTTKQDKIVDLNQLGVNPLGWNDKSVSRLNLSYLPEGMELPANGNFTVGAVGVVGADGNTLMQDGKPVYELRPHVYYDKNGNPTFNRANDTLVTKGGKQTTRNGYEYELEDVYGSEEPMMQIKSAITGKWTKVPMSAAQGMWRNMIEGGYASEAEKDQWMKVIPGEYARGVDLENSYKHSNNRQSLAEVNNKMYNDDPEATLKFRAEEQDDYLRYQHFKATGEQLPKDYFMPQILEEQTAQQDRINKFLETIKSGGNPFGTTTPVNQGSAANSQNDIPGSGAGKIDWSKANWSKDYTKLLQGLEGNADALRAEIDRTNAKIKAQGAPANEQQIGHLNRLNYMMNSANISSGSYDPGNRFEAKPAVPDKVVKVSNAAAPLAKATAFTGTPYKWGGTTPDGFDCSGLTQYVFKQAGVDLPRTAAEQYKVGKAVPLSEAKANDLVFFERTDGRKGITHVGIIQGDGTFLGAQTKGVGTQNLNSDFWKSRIVGVKRVGEFDAKEEKVSSMTASTGNNVVNAVTKLFNPTAAAPAASNSNTTDWTKYNWSKEYGNFLNDIQNDPAKVDAELNKTLNKIQELGAKAGNDQYAHLERLQSMKANLPKAVANPQAAYNDFTQLPPTTQQQITAPQDSLVELLRQQMEAGNAQMDKFYEQYMDMANNMSVPQVAKLTWDQAMKQASAQLDPLYKEKMDATMDAVNQDLISRGFFGQVPGAVVASTAAAKVVNEQVSSITQFAQGLVDRSAEEANQIMQAQMQQQQQQLSNYLQGINLYSASQQSKKGDLMSLLTYYQGERQYKDAREDTAFEKSLKVADLQQREENSKWTQYIQQSELSQREREFITTATGMIDGNPTMATQKILQDMGMKKAELEMSAAKTAATLEQGWKKIELDTAKFNQSVYKTDSENTLKSDTNDITRQKYYTDIQVKANDAAMKEFTMMGYAKQLATAKEDGDTAEAQRLARVLDNIVQKKIAIFSGINPGTLNIPNTSGRPSEY